MINLLPPVEKKIIDREYNLRRLAVILSSVLVLIVLADILLFPSYILMLYRYKVALDSGENQVDTTQITERSALTLQLKQFQQLANALNPQPIKPLPTDILTMIVKDKTTDNILNSITYTEPTDGAYQVSVTGVAKTRESLQSFVEALRRELGVTKVDLPISNFARDTSISFSFIMTGTK